MGPKNHIADLIAAIREQAPFFLAVPLHRHSLVRESFCEGTFRAVVFAKAESAFWLCTFCWVSEVPRLDSTFVQNFLLSQPVADATALSCSASSFHEIREVSGVSNAPLDCF